MCHSSKNFVYVNDFSIICYISNRFDMCLDVFGIVYLFAHKLTIWQPYVLLINQKKYTEKMENKTKRKISISKWAQNKLTYTESSLNRDIYFPLCQQKETKISTCDSIKAQENDYDCNKSKTDESKIELFILL